MPPEIGLLNLEEPSDGGKSAAMGTDPDGGRSLILTDGTSCGECCGGACRTIRQYDRCPIPEQHRPCNTVMNRVWLCDDRQCPSGGVGDVIRWNMMCFRRSDVTIPVQQLPYGERLLRVETDAWTCVEGCTTDCYAICPAYYKATPCPGQGDVPDVYFDAGLLALAGGCFVKRYLGFNLPNGQNPCYMFAAGVPILTLPPNANVEGTTGFPNPIPRLCCQCVSGCNVATSSVASCWSDTDPPFAQSCCCSNSYCDDVSYSSTWTNVVSPTPDDPVSHTSRSVRTATGRRCVVNGAIVSSTGTERILTTIDDGFGNELVIEDRTIPFTAEAACTYTVGQGIPSIVAGPQVFDTLTSDWSCPRGSPAVYDFADGFGLVIHEEVTSASLSGGCNLLQAAWSGYSVRRNTLHPDIATVTRTGIATYTARRTQTGACAGGCGGPPAPFYVGQTKALTTVATTMPVVNGALPDGSGAATLFLRGGRQ